MATTKHTCGGPKFGRKTSGCPRCDELLAGAEPVSWGGRTAAQKRRDEAQQAAARRAHFGPGGPHATGKCGSVCTAFDW
jgi:hypothetical protein